MMFFTIIGYVFVALFIFLLGCIRGECMEKERAEKMLDSGKPFYTKSDGTNIYVQTTMHTTREIKIIGNKFKLKEYEKA